MEGIGPGGSGSVVDGSMVAPSGTPGAYVSLHGGSQAGAHGSACIPPHGAPLFHHRARLRQPLMATTVKIDNAAKNNSLFMANFSAQATCINHGSRESHNSTTPSVMCK